MSQRGDAGRAHARDRLGQSGQGLTLDADVDVVLTGCLNVAD